MIEKLEMTGARRLWLLVIGMMLVVSGNARADSLQDLIRLAVTVHPSVASATAALAAMGADLETAKWQGYPEISASVSDLPFAGSGKTDRSVTLQLKQPLWTNGRIDALKQRAQEQVNYAEASLGNVQLQLAIRVIEQYGVWYGAYLKSCAYNDGLAEHLRLQEQVIRRMRSGAASGSDIAFVAARIQMLKSDAEAAKTTSEAALTVLSTLVGEPVSENRLLATLAVPLQVNVLDVDKLIADMEMSSVALKMKRAQISAAEADSAMERAKNFPEVSVSLQQQFSGTSAVTFNDTQIVFEAALSPGPGLSFLSRRKSAEARVSQAENDEEVERNDLVEQLRGDAVKLRQIRNQSNALETLRKLNRETQRSWVRQFVEGRRSWVDVMNAARETVQSDVQFADLKGSALVYSWRLNAVSKGLTALFEAQKELVGE